jgi:hypothetical protein
MWIYVEEMIRQQNSPMKADVHTHSTVIRIALVQLAIRGVSERPWAVWFVA